MKARIFILGLLFAVFWTASSSYADVPQMINYHGQLTTPEGDLIDTTVTMTFAVYADSVGGDPLWSEIQESVKVEKGVFSVLLGSVNPIPAEAFESGLRYLGVKVGLDPEMTPRSQIASVGYAFHSQRADTAEYALGGAGKQGNGWEDIGEVVRLETATDRVGIGATDPDSKLEICSPGLDHVGLSLDGNTIKSIFTCPGTGKPPLRVDLNLESAGWGDIVLDPGWVGWVRMGGNIQADSNFFFNSIHHSVMGVNYPDETFDIRLRVTAGRDDTYNNDQGACIDLHGVDHHWNFGRLDLVAGSGSEITFWTGTGAQQRMVINNDGNVGIGKDDPTGLLHLKEFGSMRTDINLENGEFMPGGEIGALRFRALNEFLFGTDYAQIVGLTSYTLPGSERGQINFETAVNGSMAPRMTIEGDKVGIGTASPADKLEVLDTQAAGGGVTTGHLTLGKFSDGSAVGWIRHPDQLASIGLDGWAGGIYMLDANVGIGTTNPTARLTIQGGIAGGSVINAFNAFGDLIVAIGEGLDYSETFPISQDDVTPGMVMVIDPVNKGNLAASTQAYDSKVAGIVAGANGLGSGVRLGSGSEEAGEHAVALAGRVYCNVDTRYGDIQPGDLLTTSPTHGHAMVVKDLSKAQGAILGKAMEGLSGGGQGQILVLVTLQ